MVSVLLPTVTAAGIPPNIGFLDQKPYIDAIEKNYKADTNKDYPDIGLLDVSVNMLTGYLIFIVTIDNATTKHVYDAVMLGSYAYLQHYSQYNWPDKAIIYVDKAGGSQIGYGNGLL